MSSSYEPRPVPVNSTGPVRVTPANVRDDGRRCPHRLADKTRPAAPRPRRPGAGRALLDSTLRALDDVLDLVEFRERSLDEALAEWRASPARRVHPGLDQWTEHAVRGYLAASAALPGGTLLEPMSRTWARQRAPRAPGDPDVYEEIVTGRRYAGHRVRELRLVRTGSVRDRPRDEAEIAVAVGVLAGGRPVLGPKWGPKPLTLGAFEPARGIRLVEIGCLDASHQVLFEGTSDQAYARYDAGVEARVRKVITGGSYRPGEDCGRCPTVADCPAVPSRPGLLGISNSGQPRRSWSMTTGRSYQACPARAHLEDLFLPRAEPAEGSQAVERGRAVHAWIESRHSRAPQRPCSPDDVPRAPDDPCEVSAAAGLEARLTTQMIGDHALVCPVREHPDAELQPERAVAAYDPDADVVVIAKTDLLYRVAEQWTLRETKTTRVLSEGDPLERYPQLALAVVLADAGVLPGDTPCRVELERLTSSGPVLTEVEATAPDQVTRARQILEGYVHAWHADSRYPASPGKVCESCPYTRWCPDTAEGSSR